MNKNTNTETADFIRLIDIEAETGLSKDEVEVRIGADNVLQHDGFRCTTGDRGRALLEAHHRRKLEDARRQAEQQERLTRDARKKHAEIERGFTAYSLEYRTVEVSPVPLHVKALSFAKDVSGFEDEAIPARPTQAGWLSGTAEGGKQIGPSPSQMLAAAKERAKQRALGEPR